MGGKRRFRSAARSRNRVRKGNSRKSEANDTTEQHEQKLSNRPSTTTNRTVSIDKEISEKFDLSEMKTGDLIESATKRNNRSVQYNTTEKQVCSGSHTIQTRRSTNQNARYDKDADYKKGDTKKMKDYVVTRSLSSKRETLKTNKNTNLEKDAVNTVPSADYFKMDSHQGNSPNSNSNAQEFLDVSMKPKFFFNNMNASQTKEMGKRESKKRERKNDDIYKTHAKERDDAIKKTKRQDRKTDFVSEEIYTQENEVYAHLSKEKKGDNNVDENKEVRREGRVLRGRKEINVAEKEKEKRGKHNLMNEQNYSNGTDKKNNIPNIIKEEDEENNGEESEELLEMGKHDSIATEEEKEKEKGRERKRESRYNENNDIQKCVEKNQRSNMKIEEESAGRAGRYSIGSHNNGEGKTNNEEAVEKNSTDVDTEKKETMGNAVENTSEKKGKYNEKNLSAENIIKGQDNKTEKKERGKGKEEEIENKNDILAKSSYIKNGRVLRNLNRNNVSNDQKINSNRNTRNVKSEVSLCNIINSRRKRKNTDNANTGMTENGKNKNNAKTNNNVTVTSRRKTKKGKRSAKRGTGNAATIATKASTRSNAAKNANSGKTNTTISQNNERKGNLGSAGTSDILEENQKQRGSGLPTYGNQRSKVSIATGTDSYNNPVSHSTRYRERQNAHLEEPEQKKRKKRVTEEGSKESSKINVGENYQVQTLPTFFLCRPELVYATCDNSDSDEVDEDFCFDCAGLPCHCKGGEPKLVYSPIMLERVKERCLKSRGYHKCVKNEMELSAYVQECAKSWKMNTDEWIPFSPEYAYKLLHYANYDPLKAINIMKSRDFSFRKILDPPTRKYQNKWKPKDKREQISKSPFPSPLTIRNYLSKRHHNSGYHLR